MGVLKNKDINMEDYGRVIILEDFIKTALKERIREWNSTPYTFPKAFIYIKVDEEDDIIKKAIDKLNVDGLLTDFYVSGNLSRYIQVNVNSKSS